jgi:hypothetical protein
MLDPLRGLTASHKLLLGSIGLAWLAPVAASTPNLIYYGGPVVSHAIVVPVNWNSDVDATLQNKLPQFYADLVQSTYWDLLAQYSTVAVTPLDAQAGSGQLIARGSATAGVTIVPVQCPAGAGSGVIPCVVTEANIDDEVNRQIDLDILPAPSLDATGNVNTAYMLNFPPNVQVVFGTPPNTQTSCVDFCHANMTLLRDALNIGVGIVMDYGSSSCSTGCGSASTALQRATQNAGYALVDIVTDPLAGETALVVRPLAWYDAATGQVADYCAGLDVDLHTLTVGANTWNVGGVWSQTPPSCAASHFPYFSITPSPTSVVVNQGGTVPVSIATGFLGAPQSITLVVNDLPTGIGAAFDTPVISAGASTTLQLSADLTAAPGTLTVDVGGKGAPNTDYEVTSLTLTVRANEIFKSGFD